MIRAAWILAAKDLRLFFRDRTALLFAFLLPVAIVLAFGFIMSGVFGEQGSMGRVSLLLVDRDGREASTGLTDALERTGMVRLRLRPGGRPWTVEEARRQVEDGEAHHALVIEEGFAEALVSGELPPLRLIRDPGRAMEDRIVRAALLQAMMELTQGGLWVPVMRRSLADLGMDPEGIETVTRFLRGIQETLGAFLGARRAEGAAGGAEEAPGGGGSFLEGDFLALVPVEMEDHAPPDRPKEATFMLIHNIAGMGVMMLMFGLAAAGRTLLEERDQGTLRRLLLSRAPRESVLLGKFFSTFLTGLVQLAVVFVVGEMVFRVDLFRDPLTLGVLVLSTCLAVTAFGLLLGTWCRTTRQADGLGTLLILVMSALGGAWMPLGQFALPPAVELASKCTLTYWAVGGIESHLWNSQGLDHPVIQTAILVQLAFAVAASLLARSLFHRRFLSG